MLHAIEMASCAMINALWPIDPVLLNDVKRSSYTTTVIRQWLCKQRSVPGNGCNRFLTQTNGETEKPCSLRGPCDRYVT
jgi:hypothetical protein